ncbi:MAG TPA: GYF domain-containing protein [Gemmataceae bacterium]|nr:GYF domain-containing protein [Gemmataceae bacterium]
MSQEWYYSVDGDRQGPVTAADLKKLADAGTLKPADLVWKDGMTDWAPAKSVKGLFGGGSAGGSAAPAKPEEAPAAAPAPAKKSSLMDRLDSVKGREVEDDDRPSRRGRRDEEDDDRPSRRRRDEDDDRPRSRRRDEDEDDDRPVRSRRRDDEDEDDDRPARRRKGGRIPDDVGSTKMVAGLLGILLNSLGIHKFYLGMTGAGLIMLLGTVLTCGIGGMVFGIIGLIEGIIYLTKSDEEFYQTYIVEQKQWF